MLLVQRNGETRRLHPAAQCYFGMFDYQIISDESEHLGLYSQDGTISDNDISALDAKKLLINKETSIFENPKLCVSIFNWDNTHELSFIEQFFNRTDRHLDVGCGWGRTLIPLAERGYHVDGYDASYSLIRHALNKIDRKRTSLFTCSFDSFCAPLQYKTAYASLNTIRYASSFPSLKAHLFLIRESLLQGGHYLIHASFVNEPTKGPITSWTFIHASRSYKISWKFASIDYWKRELFEEVQLVDLESGNKYKEIQKQLWITFDLLIEIVNEVGGFDIVNIVDEQGNENIDHRHARDGRYWIVLKKR